MSAPTWDNILGEQSCPLCLFTWNDIFRFFAQSLYTWVTEETARRALAARGGCCHCHKEELRRISTQQNLCDIYGPMTARALEMFAVSEDPQAIARLGAGFDCPACEVRRESEARHTDEFLERLREEHFREGYRASCGLCLPHLTNVLKATNDAEQREFLITAQQEQLLRLQNDLAGYAEKWAVRRRHEATAGERAAPRVAVEKFASALGQWPGRTTQGQETI
ncbi:MAG: hypothetical protein AUJ92_21505 [Armatimonadetes bacterium CG2_30_59_28]|nr:hypothetical protein [Armatimonadota bacterium]OIO89427.1 MAG: hypothetical protein AUJ92_21505 [Armatimonadetes bacterium CG2_30_59_28]PIU64038.1 MAG: hypothetical protein COS85_14100 [Armatimonadetes bacterium CG07_land_8_20_14_0_80_59_28]PIY46925.1 MAG: hypothetical protein COZ05_05525 [Armatimonadetes bacterium CG_4_10_14_3_um_filter_59_10]